MRERGELPPIARVHGIEHGHAAFEFGSAVIIATCHVGPFEAAAELLHRHYPNRHVLVIGDDVTSPHSAPRQLADRYDWAVVSIHDDACAALALITCADPLGVLIVTTDMYVPGQHWAKTRFLGETVKFPTGPAFLSIETGAPILPMCSYLVGGGTFVHIAPPLWLAADDLAGAPIGERCARLTQRLADVMTDLIEDAPEQWFPPRALALV